MALLVRSPEGEAQATDRASTGHHGPDGQMWTEGFQEWVYREQIKYIPELQSVRGMSPWNLHDFRALLRRRLHGLVGGE